MKCTQRLYLTADRKKVVGEGDKKAATLYAVPGDEIPESAAEQFGLVDGHLKGFDLDGETARRGGSRGERPPRRRPSRRPRPSARRSRGGRRQGEGRAEEQAPAEEEAAEAERAAEKEKAKPWPKRKPPRRRTRKPPAKDKEQKAGADKESGAGQAGKSGDKA
jgi:hypothetical protein